MIPKQNAVYKHFKGNLYKVITLAVHSETGEQMVIYQGLYGDFPVYCRPLDVFVSEVDHEKYPEVKQRFRFEPVEELLEISNCAMPEVTAVKSVRGLGATSEDGAVDGKVIAEARTEQIRESEESQSNSARNESVDPLILAFLDAETNAERKNILTALHHKITNEMIDTLAVVMDVVIEEGEVEDRYQQLKNCLITIDKYEIERK